MSGILVLTAAELEARRLARELELPPLEGLPFPAFGRGRVRLAPVGLRAGLLAARWEALAAPLDRPLVVSAGVCGGLHPALRAGDLVLPESVMGPSGELHNVTPSRHRDALVHAGPLARTGTLVTTAEIVAAPEAKAELYARTGALAVDMESAVILARAVGAGCPTLVVRGVSDAADEHLPLELVGLLTPEGRLQARRALALGVKRPAVLPRALVLGRATRRALGAVARVLAGFCGS